MKTIYPEPLYQVFIVDAIDGKETAVAEPASRDHVELFLASFNSEARASYAVAREIDRRSIRFTKRTITAPSRILFRVVG